jgi:AmmeMemoRadiSam system protein A
MARSRSGDVGSADGGLSDSDAELLLDLAELAIRSRLDGIRFPGPDAHRLPDSLLRPCRAFVTLHVDGALNGCIGNIESDEPLGVCVADLAVKAAFEDPRLPRLERRDLDRLEIEIALLSPLRAVPAAGRDELLDHLRPGIDGLMIAAAGRLAVFLPVVWQTLPDRSRFLDELLRKAGLPTATWPGDLTAEVFTTTTVSRDLTRSN